MVTCQTETKNTQEKTKIMSHEMISQENVHILVERWRDVLHQINDLKVDDDKRLTDHSVHRILSCLMEEVVVAEGGKAAVPPSVPYKEMEKAARDASETLQLIERNGMEWDRGWICETARLSVERMWSWRTSTRKEA